METETTLVDYSRKRTRSESASEESGDDILRKKTVRRWYYVLESESSLNDPSDDVETIYSYQDATTEWAQDTPDTESEPQMIEFELASSDGEENNIFTCSSEPEARCIIPVEGDSGSLSSIEGSSQDESPLRLEDYDISGTTCFECGVQRTRHPQLTVCDKCFKVRKKSFPPRTNRRKRNRGALRNHMRPNSVSSNSVNRTSSGDKSTLLISSQETTSTMPASSQASSMAVTDLLSGDYCKMCYNMPQSAGFVHRRIVHVLGCYECSYRIWKTIGRCPVCNMRIESVAKVIIV